MSNEDIHIGFLGVAAFGLLSGCGSSAPAAAGPSPSAQVPGVPSFMVEPDAIRDSKISQTKTADIIVVGSGVSGL